MSSQIFNSQEALLLECGEQLDAYQLAYHTYGQLNATKSNVVWICHALTASSDAQDWWSGLVGPGKLIDTNRYFVVCANMIGSCYGSTGPASIDPRTKKAFKNNFPIVTIKDMVHSFKALADHLQIEQIHCCLGGSTGGMQVVEWAILEPNRFKHVAMLACDAKFSPWGIAFNESQRMALLADSTIYDDGEQAGQAGLAAARSIAMLSYRHFDVYNSHQAETESGYDGYKASSYQQYQGLKLTRRFDPWSYYYLSKAMDSHDVGRHRGGVENALNQITAKATVIGIDRDILFPFHEQELLAECIKGATLFRLESKYGHDAFLIEYSQLVTFLQPIF